MNRTETGMCGHCSCLAAGLLSQLLCVFFSARITTRLDGPHAPVRVLRKYLLPVAPGCGALVLLKCTMLEVTRKHRGVCTWALLGFSVPRKCTALRSGAW